MIHYTPFKNIDYLTLYYNTKYYEFLDNIHVKEIFNVNDDILCVFNLDKFKSLFEDCDFLNVLETSKITINNLIYNTDLKYVTINNKSNELLVYYIIKDEQENGK